MRPVDIVAAGAVSALGTDQEAWSAGEPGAPARTAVERDPELAAAGLARPFAARARGVPDGEDRAASLLATAAGSLVQSLDRRLPDWRSRRVAIAVGTSGGGMPSQVRAFEQLDGGRALPAGLARSAPYFGPLATLERVLAVDAVERVQVLAACASSTAAVVLASRWLDSEVADLVIAGGYDALSVFIAAGFEALGATTASSPAPFRIGRDGMAIGEGAALVALVREGAGSGEPLGQVLGAGLSSDAIHVTAPDRNGHGLAAAARRAIADAGLGAEDVDLVSAHGTATPFNDAAEARALEAVLGARAHDVPVHPFKAVIGHCLGAGGVLESLAAVDALRRGFFPAAVGGAGKEPEPGVRLLETGTPSSARTCLKLSAAFGGANAALVVGRATRHAAPCPRREVELRAVGAPCVALDVAGVSSVSEVAATRLSRLDAVSTLVIGAAASAIARLDGGAPPGSGIVLGSAAATIEINAVYDARRRSRGARWVEPRRFPATSPNLAVGQCSIAFQLQGPGLAVGFGPAAATEALLVAFDLIAAGDADAMLVVAADDVGGVVRGVWDAAGWPRPEHGACAVVLGVRRAGESIQRDRLAACHAAATRAAGRVGQAAPGWPSLLAAVATVVDLASGSGTVAPLECAGGPGRSA